MWFSRDAKSYGVPLARYRCRGDVLDLTTPGKPILTPANATGNLCIVKRIAHADGRNNMTFDAASVDNSRFHYISGSHARRRLGSLKH
jgi:hypothetical protein